MRLSKTASLPRWIPGGEGRLLNRIARFVIRRRIPISLLVFTALMLEDVLTGVKPHDVANWHDWHSVCGMFLVVSGLALRSWAAGTLNKRCQLTVTGPYSLMRNPLYVGSIVMMLGFCQLIDDPENVFFVLGPFVAIYVLKVRDEERVLGDRFGLAWRRYAETTPRFCPRRWAHHLLADWSFSRWLINREYKSLATSVAGFAALKLWFVL